MVKRSTDFKQMYLVDATFLKYHEQLNQNVKNSISNNHQISVSIPETRNTSDKSYTALSKQNDLNSLTFNNLNQSENNRIDNVVNTEDLPINNNLDQHNVENMQYEESENDENNDKDYENENDSLHVGKMSYKGDNDDNDDDKNKEVDSSYKIKKVLFKCVICKKIFPSKFLLQKHLFLKHKNTKPISKSNQSRMDDQPKDENAENTQVSHDFNDQINSQEYQKEKHDDRKNLKPYIKGNERKTLVDNNLLNSSNNPDESLNQMDNHSHKQTMKHSNLKHNRLKPYITIKKDNQKKFPNSHNDTTDNSGYICVECNISFKNYSSLYNHIKRKHKNDDMNVTFPSVHSQYKAIAKLKDDQYQQNIEELQSYYCSSCGKFFKNFKLLHSHLEIEHHNAPLRAKRSKTKDKVDRKKVLYYKNY